METKQTRAVRTFVAIERGKRANTSELHQALEEAGIRAADQDLHVFVLATTVSRAVPPGSGCPSTEDEAVDHLEKHLFVHHIQGVPPTSVATLHAMLPLSGDPRAAWRLGETLVEVAHVDLVPGQTLVVVTLPAPHATDAAWTARHALLAEALGPAAAATLAGARTLEVPLRRGPGSEALHTQLPSDLVPSSDTKVGSREEVTVKRVAVAERGQLAAGGVLQLRGLLTRDEAQGLLTYASKQLQWSSLAAEYAPKQRTGRRALVYSQPLADLLWMRLKSQLHARDWAGLRPPGFAVAGGWIPTAVNPMMRFARYDATTRGHFAVHRDGAYFFTDAIRSVVTLLVYLNDAGSGSDEAFKGGATRFFAEPDAKRTEAALAGEMAATKRKEDNGGTEMAGAETARVQPEMGAGALFAHDTLHCGDQVLTGSKFILRTDVFFCRSRPADADAVARALADPRYFLVQHLFGASVRAAAANEPVESTRLFALGLRLQRRRTRALPALPTPSSDKKRARSGQSEEDAAGVSWLARLSETLLALVGAWVGPRELTQLGSACRALFARLESSSLWRRLYAARWPTVMAAEERILSEDARNPALADYRAAYRRRHLLALSLAHAQTAVAKQGEASGQVLLLLEIGTRLIRYRLCGGGHPARWGAVPNVALRQQLEIYDYWGGDDPIHRMMFMLPTSSELEHGAQSDGAVIDQRGTRLVDPFGDQQQHRPWQANLVLGTHRLLHQLIGSQADDADFDAPEARRVRDSLEVAPACVVYACAQTVSAAVRGALERAVAMWVRCPVLHGETPALVLLGAGHDAGLVVDVGHLHTSVARVDGQRVVAQRIAFDHPLDAKLLKSDRDKAADADDEMVDRIVEWRSEPDDSAATAVAAGRGPDECEVMWLWAAYAKQAFRAGDLDHSASARRPAVSELPGQVAAVLAAVDALGGPEMPRGTPLMLTGGRLAPVRQLLAQALAARGFAVSEAADALDGAALLASLAFATA